MLTPSLATGAAAGSAAGVLAITQRAPIWAALFVWELARPPLWLIVVFLAAAARSYGLKMRLDRVLEARRHASDRPVRRA